MSNPRFLNLDELETPGSQITIRFQKVDYEMVVLDVESFIDQAKRAAEHEALVAAAAAGDPTSDEVQATEQRAVELIRDAVLSFFPTLPVGKMPVHKLFAIFGWLNQMSADAGAIESAEGNAEGETN